MIIEVLSLNTFRDDLRSKTQLYANLGVREIFFFDPTGEFIDPPLRGLRLKEHGYDRLSLDERSSLISTELGLTIQLVDDDLILIETKTGIPLSTEGEEALQEARTAKLESVEAKQVADEAKEIAEEATRRAAQLEEEVRHLRALLGRE